MNNNIMTKWGENLNIDNIHNEYPRPQFVRNSFLCLNGAWKYSISESASIPNEYQGEIVVPFSPECPLSGVNKVLSPNEYLHYYKSFSVPYDFNKGKVILHFGAIDQTATVYFNNELCAQHSGGYLPFSVDVSDLVKIGINEIKVVVRDLSDTSYFSRGKQKFNRGQIWYSPQSGIWQTVWLESMSRNSIDSVKITPEFDSGTVKIELNFYGEKQNCKVQVLDNSTVVAEGDTDGEIKLKINGFKSWSPESPFLYDLVFSTENEKIKSYFAMRKFSIGSDDQGVPRLCLNNKPYFHNGVLDQGYYPDGFLTPPSDEAMIFDINAMKEMGFNMIRKHIKIEPLRWYYHCDRLGMLVWQDMVNGGEKYGLEVSAIPFVNIVMDDTKYKNFGRANEDGRKMFLEEVKQTVELLYNVPSIAMWVPFNEGWGQFDGKKVHALVRSMDSTRTIDHASGWHDQGAGDVVSKHIYFTPIKVKQHDIPYVLSEFGGLGLRVDGHTFNDKMFGYKLYKSKETIMKAYSKLFNNVIIPQISKGLSATVYTQLTDVEDELNGFYTYDRKVCKFDIAGLKKINNNVKIL